MPKIDVLIDLFFKDQSWEKRTESIAACGYAAVETWQGADANVLQQIATAGKNCGVELVSIVMNGPGDSTKAPVNPANLSQFLEQMDRFSDNALAAGCRQGIVTTGPSARGQSYQTQRQALVDALRLAGEAAAQKGFVLNLEPLNLEVDHAGYFLGSREDSVAIVKEVGLANVRLLYDIYHMEIAAGNQVEFIKANIPWIGHFHVAGVPGRNEPFQGETNYPFVMQHIAASGYEGFVGLEYIPLLESRESLERTRDYLSGH